MSRFKLVLVLVAAAIAWPAAAQDYPARNVKIIVPFGAGGPADVYARFIGQHLSEALKRSFVIENRPGAGAVIGTDEAAKAPPDGYTLLMMSNTHTTNETLIPQKPYQLMRDFVPVAPVNYSDLLLVVHPSVPANNLSEFVAHAKARPGALNYASSGPGTPYHMAGAEAGVPGYEATIWLGIMAPAATPRPIVEKLNGEIAKVLKRPEVQQAWAKQCAVPMIMTPAEFDRYLRDDIEKWARVVKLSGAKVQ